MDRNEQAQPNHQSTNTENKTKEQDIIFNMNMFCSFKVVIVEYQHHQIVVDILYIYFQLELDKMY